MNISRPFFHIHGKIRGLEAPARSTLFEGRFGRMFRTLHPAIFSEAALAELAREQHIVAKAEEEGTPETAPDDEENVGGDATRPAISAGYTYLGQFIDHDLTFDPASSLQKTNDPDALVDFRTPRFDLDNVYGRGPDDQPYMYQDDGVRFVLGRALTGNSSDTNARDLQRTASGRAIIGDPRNDENVIVSQLQVTFLRFHNRVADVLKANGPEDFAKVQETVRWHYQWMVLHDFLPTIIGREMLHSILPNIESEKSVLQDRPNLRFYQPHKEPFMPVEFSVAAYRFGHSMVRPQYRLNEVTPPVEGNPDPSGKNDPRLPIFSATALSLVGFNEFPSSWAVDWRLFFKMGDAPPLGKERIQPAYKIDTSLVNPLGNLPVAVTGPTPFPSLALRNLLRGLRLGLPSGQAVARAMGEHIIPDDELRVGKANEHDFRINPTLVSISPEFRDKAPLWYYVLADSQKAFKDNNTPIRLGRIGGRIVGEVFAGIMLGDQHSFLNHCPNWRPFAELSASDGTFGITELIGQAMQA